MANRGLIIGGGVVAAALLIAPYAVGMINENAMHREIERMQGKGLFNTRIESFDRGWFSTRALLEIGVNQDLLDQVMTPETGPMMAMMVGGFTLPVVVEIAHGPVLLDGGFPLGTAAVHAYVDPRSQLSMLAQQFLGMPYVLELHGRGTFGGGFNYTGDIPPVDFTLPDVTVSSTGVEFAGHRSRTERQFEGTLESLRLQSPFASAMLQGIEVVTDMSQADRDSVPLGTSSIALERATVTDPLQGTAGSYSLEDASMSLGVVPGDSEHLDLSASYAIGRARIGDAFDLRDLALALNLNHVDHQAVDELYALTNNLDTLPDADAQLLLLTAITEKILAGSPELSLAPLAFTTEDGTLSGSLSVGMDPTALPGGNLTELADVSVAMAALNASLDLTASKTLVNRIVGMIVEAQAGPLLGVNGEPMPPEQADAMIAGQVSLLVLALSMQGILTDDGQNYSTSIQLENGVPMANGQPLALGF